jgi:Holliday junction resolvase RusA-like endonuclease
MRVFGKFASAYSCPKQKKHIAAMQQHMSAEGGEPLEGPLHLDLIAYMPTQKSWPKKKIQAALSGSLLHTNKPDASNILKLVEDAANGILFKDDSQIVSAIVTKEYSEMPHYFLTICEMIPVGVE